MRSSNILCINHLAACITQCLCKYTRAGNQLSGKASEKRPPFSDHSAGYLFSGVTGGLRIEVIGITVDHHCSSNNFIHTKPICFHGQVCVALACQQRRQIACVFRMYLTRWIIMASCSRKVSPGAAFPLVNMESEESSFTFPWQTGDPRLNQYASVLLIESNTSG